jgi:hypothetical protein
MVATPDDEHALFAQSSQFPAQFVMGGRCLPLVQTQLNHRNIGIREHSAQHRPCAVVQSQVQVQFDRCLPHQPLCHSGQVRGTRSRVTLIEKRGRESVEIMDCLWLLHRRDTGSDRFPMRGDAEHGFGLWQGPGDLGPGPAEFGVLDCVHRVAMSDEQSWHSRLGIGSRREFANDGAGRHLRRSVVYLVFGRKLLISEAAPDAEGGSGAANG